MKPIIGITSSMELEGEEYKVYRDHVGAVSQAGGIPFLLPYVPDEKDIIHIASIIDGLYATGGYDIDPTLFNEEPHPQLGTIIPERDTFEMMLMKKVLQHKSQFSAFVGGVKF